MQTLTPPTTLTRHPLTPLTAAELQRAVQILTEQATVTGTTRFVSIALREPPKTTVLAWQPGDAVERLAFAVLFDNQTNRCYEALLSLDDNRLLSWTHIPGVQPTMTADEQIECERAVLASPEFREALLRHGITTPDLVTVDIWTVGNYGATEESTMRLARPLCFLKSDATDNAYARPIEGLKPVVDLNTMRVLRVEDYGKWPLPLQPGNYRADRVENQRTDLKPLEIIQPDGPSFTVDGYEVAWQKWNVVIGFNAREGLTLHNLTYNDNGRKRSILYRASLSEMVVPYGDPTATQRRKNAFDTGEYGMGQCANSLELGCDCLGHIQYFDAHLTDSRGGLLTIKNAICLHEEDYGILWKHTDRRDNHVEVRRSRRLVISSISTVENYEYGFYWYLYQDGNIQFEIKLTGILSLGAVHEGEHPKWGSLIAPLLYAPNHQHFFSVRLDMAVDGPQNTVYQMDVVPDEVNEDNPFENAFYAQATPCETEKQACTNLNPDTARYWKIANENARNALGEPTAYKFFAGDNCKPFATPNASWRKRAGFVNHHVWVTPFAESEYFAAGDYPNQHTGGDGLVKWVEQDRPVRNTDLVFWYTMGHTHIPRPEDYPVMPAAYIGFLLKPHGFFDQNPANDVPPAAKTNKASVQSGSCCH